MGIAIKWTGTAQDDVFIFNDGTDTVDVVYAGAGNDYIADGTDEPWTSDSFYGQGGDDFLFSRSGFDLLYGQGGDDTIKVKGSRFDVEVFGGEGHDTLRIVNAEGYSVDDDGNEVIITTRQGGTITVRGVEEFEFVL